MLGDGLSRPSDRAVRVRGVRVLQLEAVGIAVVLGLAALVWPSAGDLAGAALIIVPMVVASLELTRLVVQGRMARRTARLIRLAVVVALLVVSLVWQAR